MDDFNQIAQMLKKRKTRQEYFWPVEALKFKVALEPNESFNSVTQKG